LKKIIEIKPNDAHSHYRLGGAYVKMGLYDEAIASFKKVIELDSFLLNTLAYYRLGDAYVKKGLYDEAIVSYKKAIEIWPDYAEAHLGLGLAYFLGKGLKYIAADHLYKAVRVQGGVSSFCQYCWTEE